jgi:hypothetical protein
LLLLCKNKLGMVENPAIEEHAETEQPALIGSSSGQVVSIVTGEIVTDSTAPNA